MNEMELTREFWKHKLTGEVIVVEMDASQQVIAASSQAVAVALTCRHRLPEYQLALDAGEQAQKHRRAFESFKPACSDPGHLLADIGQAEKECQATEAAFNQAHAIAKSQKELFDNAKDRLRTLVRESTEPKPLPLFEQTA